MKKSKKTDQPSLAAQPISESDLATILSLHQRRLGWTHLLESTIEDRTVGFPCEAEELYIRRELKNTFLKVSEWFKNIGRQNKWPSAPGWNWEIDFAASQAVPKKVQQNVANEPGAAAQDSCRCDVSEGPIMTLGDAEGDIIKRLFEKRAALADRVRSHLRLVLNGEFALKDLNAMVEQVGAADKDVKDWFAAMAANYKWAKSNDSNWMYRVDVEDNKVYLMQRGGCSCM